MKQTGREKLDLLSKAQDKAAEPKKYDLIREVPDLDLFAKKFFAVNRPAAREYAAFLDALQIGFQVGQRTGTTQLRDAVKVTNELAQDLIKRAEGIDKLLLKKTKSKADGVELGEIVRLRQQISRNVSLLAAVEKEAA